jgi:hypothetical protein
MRRGCSSWRRAGILIRADFIWADFEEGTNIHRSVPPADTERIAEGLFRDRNEKEGHYEE